METRSTPSDTGEGLPREVPEASRVYLRPAGLLSGKSAEFLLAAGEALPLAGGRFAFTGCEVIFRELGRIARVVGSVNAVLSWSEALNGAVGNRVAGLLERLTAPRRDPRGAPLTRPLLMGIVNVTPDSFSDGGNYFDSGAAVAHAQELAAAGADILDIGGESTRPGADPVDPSAERNRVLPVIEALASARTGTPVVSIDTRHAEVMKAALAAGATMVNDVTALTGDPRSLAVAAAGAEAVVLMHMQGEPRTMNLDPSYDDVVLDIYDFLENRVAACIAAGIRRDRLIVDPGVGFGKKGRYNLEILRSLAVYHGIGCPVLLGISRKGLTGEMDRKRLPRERLPGSLAAGLWALDRGGRFSGFTM